MGEIPGLDQRAMGKTRIVAEGVDRELAARSEEAELLLCSDPISRARRLSRPHGKRRTGTVSAQLQSLSRLFASRADRHATGCNRAHGGSRRGAASGVREVLPEA